MAFSPKISSLLVGELPCARQIPTKRHNTVKSSSHRLLTKRRLLTTTIAVQVGTLDGGAHWGKVSPMDTFEEADLLANDAGGRAY